MRIGKIIEPRSRGDEDSEAMKRSQISRLEYDCYVALAVSGFIVLGWALWATY